MNHTNQITSARIGVAEETRQIDAARRSAAADLLQSKQERIVAFVQSEMDRLKVFHKDFAHLVHCAMLRVANAAILIDHGQHLTPTLSPPGAEREKNLISPVSSPNPPADGASSGEAETFKVPSAAAPAAGANLSHGSADQNKLSEDASRGHRPTVIE